MSAWLISIVITALCSRVIYTATSFTPRLVAGLMAVGIAIVASLFAEPVAVSWTVLVWGAFLTSIITGLCRYQPKESR